MAFAFVQLAARAGANFTSLATIKDTFIDLYVH